MKIADLTALDLTRLLRARLATQQAADVDTRDLTGLLRSVRGELNTRACKGDTPAAFALEMGPMAQ